MVDSNRHVTWDGLRESRQQGKSFEGPSKGEGQATAWAPQDQGYGEEEITFIKFCTN